MIVHSLRDVKAKTKVKDCTNGIPQKEIDMMGKILMERHGAQAYALARQFMQDHKSMNSVSHARAWERVAQYIFENTKIS